jgi:hypothetical protein
METHEERQKRLSKYTCDNCYDPIVAARTSVGSMYCACGGFITENGAMRIHREKCSRCLTPVFRRRVDNIRLEVGGVSVKVLGVCMCGGMITDPVPVGEEAKLPEMACTICLLPKIKGAYRANAYIGGRRILGDCECGGWVVTKEPIHPTFKRQQQPSTYTPPKPRTTEEINLAL